MQFFYAITRGNFWWRSRNAQGQFCLSPHFAEESSSLRFIFFWSFRQSCVDCIRFSKRPMYNNLVDTVLRYSAVYRPPWSEDTFPLKTKAQTSQRGTAHCSDSEHKFLMSMLSILKYKIQADLFVANLIQKKARLELNQPESFVAPSISKADALRSAILNLWHYFVRNGTEGSFVVPIVLCIKMLGQPLYTLVREVHCAKILVNKTASNTPPSNLSGRFLQWCTEAFLCYLEHTDSLIFITVLIVRLRTF